MPTGYPALTTNQKQEIITFTPDSGDNFLFLIGC
ncbi:MAG: hypothetical protein ACJA02_001012 [Myxococcota bacterium]|jgi:hypothetical protein